MTCRSTSCTAASATATCTRCATTGGGDLPIVPGHEIVGRITSVGPQVKKLKIGEMAGVGCMVYSCRTCASCREGLEQYCEKGPTWTYNSEDTRFGGMTLEATRSGIVVDEAFVVRVPAAGPAQPPASVRRYHHVFSPAPMEGRQGAEGRRGWPWRTGPHGSEAGASPRGRGGRIHDAGGKEWMQSALARTRW